MFTMPDALVIFGGLIALTVGILKVPAFFNGHGKNGSVTEKLCQSRYGNLKEDIGAIKTDIKTLLKHHKIESDI